MAEIINSIAAMNARSEELRRTGQRIGLVPTMGALHEGHLSLIDIARASADVVVVSVYVNPTQFGPSEDFDAYPRRLADDAEKAGSRGAAIVFAPTDRDMYPEGYATYVTVERLTESLCGKSRPGHFRGVTTVVTKLFGIARPHVAVFGDKDLQQLTVLRRMTRDLNLGVEIVGAPIVREADGLAMSSRNAYLTPVERAQATVIHRALEAAGALTMAGERDAAAIIQRAADIIGSAPLARVEYIELVDPENLTPVVEIRHRAVLAVAAWFGSTRLIDNRMIACHSE